MNVLRARRAQEVSAKAVSQPTFATFSSHSNLF